MALSPEKKTIFLIVVVLLGAIACMTLASFVQVMREESLKIRAKPLTVLSAEQSSALRSRKVRLNSRLSSSEAQNRSVSESRSSGSELGDKKDSIIRDGVSDKADSVAPLVFFDITIDGE